MWFRWVFCWLRSRSPPKLSKLNPLEGAKRVFGTSAFVKAGLDSLKVVLVLCVVILTVNGMHDKVMLLPMLPLPAACWPSVN